MKKLLYLLPLCLCLFTVACNNSAETETDEIDSVEIVPQTLLWQAEMNDSTGKLEMTKDKPAGLDSLGPEPIVGFLNQTNPNVQIQYLKTSGDTVYLKIPDAHYLTQQMGSTGPVYFFAAAVYNLTEVPGIHYVNFDFEEGDHATPGVMSRDSFKDQ